MTPEPPPATAVVGVGLLGGAVVQRLGSGAVAAEGVAWTSPADSQRQVRAFGERVARRPGWRAAWCAGASFVGASPATMKHELDAVSAFLQGLTSGEPSGRLFIVSSAGGVHGGGGPEVISEHSPLEPRSAYGEGKVAVEQLLTAWAAETSVPTLIGRISNLYGPGQDLSKPQGFISHLCRNALRNEPTVLRVPLETCRDFLHADDAAARIVRWLFEAQEPPAGATTKLLVSGVSMTLARTIALTRAVSRRRTLLVHVDDGRLHEQPRYLRFRSTVRTDLDRAHQARPLEVGIVDVFEWLRRNAAVAGFR